MSEEDIRVDISGMTINCKQRAQIVDASEFIPSVERLGLLGRKLAWHIAAHHAKFLAAFSASAFCKLQLILRSGGCGVGMRGAECHTLFGVAGFAPEL